MKHALIEVTEIIFAIIISILMLWFFTSIFQVYDRLSGVSYLGLATLSVFTGLVLYFRKTLKEIDIKNLKLILEKTEKVKTDIDQVAFHLAKIIANLSAHSTGTWLNRKRLNDDIEHLLDNLEIEPDDKIAVLELPRIIEKKMKDKVPLTKYEQKKIDEMFTLKV